MCLSPQLWVHRNRQIWQLAPVSKSKGRMTQEKTDVTFTSPPQATPAQYTQHTHTTLYTYTTYSMHTYTRHTTHTSYNIHTYTFYYWIFILTVTRKTAHSNTEFRIYQFFSKTLMKSFNSHKVMPIRQVLPLSPLQERKPGSGKDKGVPEGWQRTSEQGLCFQFWCWTHRLSHTVLLSHTSGSVLEFNGASFSFLFKTGLTL